MSDLPSLYDTKGRFKALSDDAAAALNEVQAAAYQKIKVAADALAVADNAVASSITRVKSCNDAVIEMENYIRKTFPKITFHDLWRQTFK
jgi:hypothetical protein